MKIDIERVDKNTSLGFRTEPELIRYMNDALFYLQHHNKNYTRQQQYRIDDLTEIVKAMTAVVLKAGYYEWNLYINDELFYTFGDITELLYGDKDEITAEDLYIVIDDIIDDLKTEKAEQKEKITALTADIKQAMFDGLSAFCEV